MKRAVSPCPTCHYEFVPRFPGEARLHAAFHARDMWQRKPKPEPRLAAFGGDVRVDATSPGWLQLANERDLHALVLVENGSTAVGAVAFAWIAWPDCDPGWHMNFAWIGDAWRRKGVMSQRWPRWRETYGAFTLEQPLSKAMRAFVAKAEAEAGLVAP
jgi:transposase